MQALIKEFDEKGLWLKDTDTKKIQPNEVRIKVKNASICGTDVHIYNWDQWAKQNVPLGTTLGHEFVGIVSEVGNSVFGVDIGDLVTAEGHIGCKKCIPCLQKKEHLCEHSINIGIHQDGGFADYVSVPDHNIINLNDYRDVPLEILSLLDPLGNVVHCLENFEYKNRSVLITGAGPIGLMAVSILKMIGNNFIVIADYNQYRLKLAKNMGADFTIDLNDKRQAFLELDNIVLSERFTLGLEFSGAEDAFKMQSKYISPYGRIVLLGIYSSPIKEIDLNQLIFKGVRLKGVYGRTRTAWLQALSLLKQGLDINSLVTHRFLLKDFNLAFDVINSGQAGKVVFDIS